MEKQIDKQIDKLCRDLRKYIETGYGDVNIVKNFSTLAYTTFVVTDIERRNQFITYFLQSLRREMIEPEVVNRSREGVTYSSIAHEHFTKQD
jgi:hypothetical protein